MNEALQKEQTRKRVERYTNKQKALHNGSVTPQALHVDTLTAAKLLQVCNALDKTVTGLDGKKVNLLSMVRYGVNGPTLTTVSETLRANSSLSKQRI